VVPSLLSLPWLPAPPPDFRKRCAALSPDQSDLGASIQFLGSHALDGPKATSLSRAIGRCREAAADLSPLSALRLGILGTSTLDFIADVLPAAAARHGVALDVVTGPYGQVLQQALDPRSTINGSHPDVVWLALDAHSLNLTRPCDEDRAAGLVEEVISGLRMSVEGLKRHGGAAAILQTLPRIAYPLLGSLDARITGSPHWLLDTINRRVLDLAHELGTYLLDLSTLAERIGTDRWFDPVHWHTYKLPFAADCNDIVADSVGRLLGAIRGKARKCLVLDLDNTVWGGVVGDDGVDGLVIGQGSGAGEAFLGIQQTALDLRSRGIMLAVASKNDEANARAPFQNHPDMLLREEHITVFHANWMDKAANLEAIAAALNIGLDALVLLDDNPAERAQMRAALPMVAVPELPNDPSWFPWYLRSAGYFEAVSFSSEDRLRVETYAADGRRGAVLAKARDLGDYLSALEMVITFAPFDATGRPRIAQLVNKSNQFNLTTRRYSEVEIGRIESDDRAHGLQVRLRDRFGDLGMIGVIIARDAEPGAWEIDTWLMSCRVLGRRVEEAMRDELIRSARRAGIGRLIGVYRPTAKNGMVAGHYAKLGFASLDASGDERTFELHVGAAALEDLPFTIESHFRQGDASPRGRAVPSPGP
jgi:FkbH-like protein